MVVVTPLWPNLAEIPKILGADVVRVPLVFGAQGWTLELDRLLSSLTGGKGRAYQGEKEPEAAQKEFAKVRALHQKAEGDVASQMSRLQQTRPK